MKHQLHKKGIVKKTLQVSAITFLSRVLAITREFFKIRFLGLGALSDAFIVAFRIPNLFRHIFAEGALNASFVPVYVKTIREKRDEDANGLMSMSFMFFQGILLLIYLFVLIKTHWVATFVAPGFSPEQAEYTAFFLRILFPFIFFISSSALLGGALNAVNHFFIPAFGPALINVFFVGALLLCINYNLSPLYLCYGILFAGLCQFLMHLAVYVRYGFNFGAFTVGAKSAFKNVMKKFIPCLAGVSIVEINMFVSGIIASFLPKGSVTILYYGSRFMNIPLGVFAVAFSSILLPQFSRVVLYAPKRMSYLLLESAKFISWIIIPSALFLMFTAEKIFSTMFFLKVGTPEQIATATWVLIFYTIGLLFFALNKILLNIFYSFKDTRSAAVIAATGALVNLAADLVGIYYYGIYGIAAASVLSGIVITGMCLLFLTRRHKIALYLINYFKFFALYALQLAIFGFFFVWTHEKITAWFSANGYEHIFVNHLGYWAWVLPLAGIVMLMVYVTKKQFNITVSFLKG